MSNDNNENEMSVKKYSIKSQTVDRTYWTENKIGNKFKMCTADALEMQAKIQPLSKSTTATKRLGWNYKLWK